MTDSLRALAVVCLGACLLSWNVCAAIIITAGDDLPIEWYGLAAAKVGALVWVARSPQGLAAHTDTLRGVSHRLTDLKIKQDDVHRMIDELFQQLANKPVTRNDKENPQ